MKTFQVTAIGTYITTTVKASSKVEAKKLTRDYFSAIPNVRLSVKELGGYFCPLRGSENNVAEKLYFLNEAEARDYRALIMSAEIMNRRILEIETYHRIASEG